MVAAMAPATPAMVAAVAAAGIVRLVARAGRRHPLEWKHEKEGRGEAEVEVEEKEAERERGKGTERERAEEKEEEEGKEAREREPEEHYTARVRSGRMSQQEHKTTRRIEAMPDSALRLCPSPASPPPPSRPPSPHKTQASTGSNSKRIQQGRLSIIKALTLTPRGKTSVWTR